MLTLCRLPTSAHGAGHVLDDVHHSVDEQQSAQAWEFIQALDNGFAHDLDTRGVNFSGGQKQRMLIARALASRPDILILDDSSSPLDYQTDAALRQAIKRDYKGVTTIIVAQRVSSIAHADLILVMEQGHCSGAGTHEQLRAAGAFGDLPDTSQMTLF